MRRGGGTTPRGSEALYDDIEVRDIPGERGRDDPAPAEFCADQELSDLPCQLG